MFFHLNFRSAYTSAEATSQRLGFMDCYHAISVNDLAGEMGGKVTLPASALHHISSAQNPEFPLIFELKRTDMQSIAALSLNRSPEANGDSTESPEQSYQALCAQTLNNLKKTFAGVSNFDAEEGCVLVPSWMMENLGIEDGALITVRMVSLPKGDLVALKPHDPEAFLALDQPKEALESVLRSYYALQTSDTLVVPFDGILQHFTVVHTSPSPTIDIKDTDLRLEIQMPSDFDVDKFAQSASGSANSEPQDLPLFATSTQAAPSAGETAACSNCRRAIPNASIATHEAFCRRNNVICEMCDQVIRSLDRLSHFEEVHKGVTCACGESMEIRFLPTHKQQECLHRLRPCKFCKLKKKLVDLPEHEDYCGSRTEQCSKCQRFISIKDLATHTSSNCAFPAQPEVPTFFSRIKSFFD